LIHPNTIYCVKSTQLNLLTSTSCYTGRTIWANSFNITSSTNDRAYLGWDGTVETIATYDFAQEFWPLVGTMSIRDAAVYAASQVTGSTPIRFFGDSSYDGSPY